MSFLVQGQWKHMFDKDNVFEKDFQVSPSRTCSVNMMYQENRFRYMNLPEERVQLLEMAYKGDDITMVVILPHRGTPLSEVNINDLPGASRFISLFCSSERIVDGR